MIMVVAVIGLLVSASFNSSINKTTTYIDGVIEFVYPSNMTQPSYNTTSSNTWNFTILTDNTTSVLLGKTSAISSSLISSTIMSTYLQTGNGQLLSNVTVSTNPNGVQVYQYVYQVNYTNVTYYYMDFAKKDNSIVYDISVYGNDTTESQNVANQIFNSLKLS